MAQDEKDEPKWLTLRLKPDEYKTLNSRFKKTMFRKMSEYIRSVLFQKPITVTYRDKSMDEVLEELILIRKELNSIGNNLNQAVRNINSAHGHADSRLWISLLGVINSKLEPSISQIKDRMNNFADLWSRKLRAGEA